ncbi:MAG: DUF3786 domain-containing protein [Deltaproteobacteria bacterium]|nr:DUF3786 domain-containing protein [Deltaproteobacteria bacterium]
MPRIDDYYNAAKIAIEALCRESSKDILKRSGFEADVNGICIPFLSRSYSIRFPDFVFSDTDTDPKDVPIQEQVLILHYLQARGIQFPTGNWIAYREIQGASFYFSAFVKRAIDPLKKTFGSNIQGLVKAAERLGGQPIPAGDAGFEFRILPRIPIQLILWEGDAEFPPEANILFDETIGDILSPEDVAWLAGMLVYRLMALSR